MVFRGLVLSAGSASVPEMKESSMSRAICLRAAAVWKPISSVTGFDPAADRT